MTDPESEYGYERGGVCGKGGISCREPASEQSVMAPGLYVCEGCLREEEEILRASQDYVARCALEQIAERFEFRVAEAQARMAWGNA